MNDEVGKRGDLPKDAGEKREGWLATSFDYGRPDFRRDSLRSGCVFVFFPAQKPCHTLSGTSRLFQGVESKGVLSRQRE
jgi:hypothetical protein